MKIRYIILSLFFLADLAQAQQVLLDKNVEKQNDRNEPSGNEGPNLKHFWSETISYGLVLPISDSDSLQIKDNFASKSLAMGYLYKQKITDFFAVGTNFGYRRDAYHIKQDNDKNLLGGGISHTSQKVIFNKLYLGVYMRFNFERRGNTLGRFIDIGGGGAYVFSNRFMTKDKLDPSKSGGANLSRNSLVGLDYVSAFQGYLEMKIGFGALCVFTQYRLNPAFISSDNFRSGRVLPDLPRWLVGLEVSMFDSFPEPYRGDDED